MYTPRAFEIADLEIIRAFAARNGFGILITTHDAEIETTHTPMYLSADMQQLYGHIAKANPQWKHWEVNRKAKVIFHGPHTYISPNDYLPGANVPTWNYTALAIHGELEVLSAADEKLGVLEHLIATYESDRPTPWRLDTNDEKLMSLLDAIVCFRVRVEEIQAKFKLNQNKSPEDQRNVIEQLRKRGGDMNREIAQWMEANQQ